MQGLSKFLASHFPNMITFLKKYNAMHPNFPQIQAHAINCFKLVRWFKITCWSFSPKNKLWNLVNNYLNFITTIKKILLCKNNHLRGYNMEQFWNEVFLYWSLEYLQIVKFLWDSSWFGFVLRMTLLTSCSWLRTTSAANSFLCNTFAVRDSLPLIPI